MFNKERKIKFDIGAKEHNTPWDLKHIDVIKEMKEELCDLYNYAQLYSVNRENRIEAIEIMQTAKKLWEKINVRR